MWIIIISIFVVILNGMCQIVLKISANKSKLYSKSSMRIKILHVYSLMLLGYSGFISITILTTYILKFLPLKTMTIIMSFNYVVTILLAIIILKEKVTKNKLVGTFIIIIGVLVYNV
ncbi:EamA family transporter [Paenibacillus eucommiae]|uniref:Drug/metabolite transporter (DMT)-like permease n=1 Tax=Paenibacillus eucommiae TaxID=1355755 RepID=A0ABS4IWA8_9BACL|nr:drug/metabolite transporter (DMT)-like permease [Paenibacillus eucommiae]